MCPIPLKKDSIKYVQTKPSKTSFAHMSVGWDVEWCPLSRITTLLARKRLLHWVSKKSRLVRAARETSEFLNWSLLTYSRPVIWLKYCRYGVKHYPINQLIICTWFFPLVWKSEDCLNLFVSDRYLTKSRLQTISDNFWQLYSICTIVK